MTFTAVLTRLASAGYDVRVDFLHNGYFEMRALHKGSSAPLQVAGPTGKHVLVCRATLLGGREYNVLATMDAVAKQFYDACRIAGVLS